MADTLPGATEVKAMASGGRDNTGEESVSEPLEEAISPNHNFNPGASFGFSQGGYRSQKHPTAQSEDGAAKIEDDEAVRGKTGATQATYREPQEEEVVLLNLDPADFEDRVVHPELPQDNGVAAALWVSVTAAHVLRENELMEEHNSYHQNITGKEAEKRLRKCGNHCYLTRYSDARKCYMLTVLRKRPTYEIKHFKIFFQHYRDGHKVYKINGKNQEFRGIGEMLGHYENHRIDPAFAHIGRCIPEQEYTSMWCIIL